MRRIPIVLLICVAMLVLAGCGNKGPLVRPPVTPDAVQPAPAGSTAAAAAASAPSSTAPAYLSPPMPASSAGHPL